MTTPESSKVYINGAKLADALVKGGVPLYAQGVEVNGTRCFVFEVKPEYTRVLRKVLKNGFQPR